MFSFDFIFVVNVFPFLSITFIIIIISYFLYYLFIINIITIVVYCMSF